MQIKGIPVLILFLTLFAGGCARKDAAWTDSKAQTADPAADVTLKTPEEAVTHYLEGVARNDVRRILQASAVNEMSAKFKFDLFAERLGAIDPVRNLSPAEYPFYSEINKSQLSFQILSHVKNLSYGLLSGEEMDGTIFKADAERVNRFVKNVDPQRLSRLEVRKISPPNKTVMNDARYLENAARNARIYGADESTERVALFSFEQNYYYVGFTLLRYGTNWKIYSQDSPLANTSPLGTAEKTTEAEFESMTNK